MYIEDVADKAVAFYQYNMYGLHRESTICVCVYIYM